MRCLRLLLTAAAGVWLLASPAPAQAPPALLSAHGVVDRATKDTLTVKPRGADGRFEKALELQVTGTSRVATLTTQTRAGKPVAVQTDTDAKELKPQQAIAVIYTQAASGPVLLTAVVLPAK